jgi:hypothetical protein
VLQPRGTEKGRMMGAKIFIFVLGMAVMFGADKLWDVWQMYRMIKKFKAIPRVPPHA